MAVGFWREDAYPEGPLHDQAVAPVVLEFSVSVPPAQIAPVFVMPDEVGTAFTVTVDV